jgi:hypothetical protein
MITKSFSKEKKKLIGDFEILLTSINEYFFLEIYFN